MMMGKGGAVGVIRRALGCTSNRKRAKHFIPVAQVERPGLVGQPRVHARSVLAQEHKPQEDD